MWLFAGVTHFCLFSVVRARRTDSGKEFQALSAAVFKMREIPVWERNDLKSLNAKPRTALQAAVRLADPGGREGTCMGHDNTYSGARKT